MMEKPNIGTIKQKSKEFDVPFHWALERKKRYIASLLTQTKKQINKNKKLLRKTKKTEERKLLMDGLEKLEKEFGRHRLYLRYLNNPKEDTRAITDEEVEIARNYPIWEFLPEGYKGKGNIRCLFADHEDKHASMQVNTTWLWCHTCQRKMDTLELVMMKTGLDFKSAVKLLARS